MSEDIIFNCFTEAQIIDLANRELKSANKKLRLNKTEYFAYHYLNVLVCSDKNRNLYTVHLAAPQSHLLGIRAINRIKMKFSKFKPLPSGNGGLNLTNLIFNGTGIGDLDTDCEFIRADLGNYQHYWTESLSEFHDDFVVQEMLHKKLTNAGYVEVNA